MIWTHRHAKIALALVTLLAAALRFFRIDAQSAWVDEAFTINAAVAEWDEMLGILVADFNHPPLHTILVRWWFSVVEAGVFEARVLSAAWGVLSVPAIYWLGRLLFDRRVALTASLLLAISQLGVVYSQEARAYSLQLLLVILVAGFFIRAFRLGRFRDFAAFVIVVSLLLYTHYYSVFAIIALLTYALLYRRRSALPVSWWGGALIVTLIAYLPWLTSGVVGSVIRNPRGAVDERVFAQLISPLYALNWFNNGKIAGVREQAPWWTFLVGCVLFSIPAFAAVWFQTRRSGPGRDTTLLLVLLCAVPIVAVTALGSLHVVYDVRHVAFAIAPYYLLVACGISLVGSSALRSLLVVAVVSYSAVSLRATYSVPYKENYRDAFRTLVAQSRTGDCTIYGAPDGDSYARWYWTSYYGSQEPPALVSLDEAARRTDCRRIWLLWDRTFWKAGPMTYAAAKDLVISEYRAGPQWSFIGVDLQLFSR